MTEKILIVDDEKDILSLLKFNLKAEGYKIFTAMDGEQALDLAEEIKPDLILLDIMLPGKDGLQVIKELRKNNETENIPVIFLTAKDSEIDEVVGLELGADDYIVKPISMRKLLARVKNVFRKTRTTPPIESKLQFGDIVIDPDSYEVKIAGKPLTLTKKEFEILTYLAQRPGRVITREILLNEIWGYNVVVVDRTIDVHIRNIREKLGVNYMDNIETIKGVGYRFKTE